MVSLHVCLAALSGNLAGGSGSTFNASEFLLSCDCCRWLKPNAGDCTHLLPTVIRSYLADVPQAHSERVRKLLPSLLRVEGGAGPGGAMAASAFLLPLLSQVACHSRACTGCPMIAHLRTTAVSRIGRLT